MHEFISCLYLVPLVYISVFVPGPYCLDDCGFVVESEVRQEEKGTTQDEMAGWHHGLDGCESE